MSAGSAYPSNHGHISFDGRERKTTTTTTLAFAVLFYKLMWSLQLGLFMLTKCWQCLWHVRCIIFHLTAEKNAKSFSSPHFLSHVPKTMSSQDCVLSQKRPESIYSVDEMNRGVFRFFFCAWWKKKQQRRAHFVWMRMLINYVDAGFHFFYF